MKTALLISGYLRSFSQNLPKLKSLVIDKLTNVDVYIHLTRNEHKDDRYLNPSDLYSNIKLIESELRPKCLLIEDNLNIQNSTLINTWVKYFKLNNIKQMNERIYGDYDLVIKYRPDIDLISENIFSIRIDPNVVYIPRDSKIDKSKLTNPTDKYLCDMLAFGSSKVMNRYFSIYEQLQELISKHGDTPETVLYNHLTTQKIKYTLLDIEYSVILSKCNVFGISGDSGSGKSTLAEVIKQFFSNSFTLEGDRYHKWERGDKKWKKYTHLNPEANYLTKMNSDIFNLKLGNAIYQVDYDHKNGKFTEKQLIQPNDNIIVCGLHSLYTEHEQIYDMKIFMDTDDKLKLKWKIERDVNQRGHTIESVLEQINRRRGEFEKYIYPQRNAADLIVRFYINQEEETHLELFVKKSYDIRHIIESLKINNVKYVLSEEENFISVKFTKYEDISLWGEEIVPTFKNYYDYIMYFIFNIPKRK